ncbi:MAG: tetraacyldisaccharide 4'-kinase [Pseudomonadota bacterium]
MISPPAFWSDPDGARHPLARLLSPLSVIYTRIVAGKIRQVDPVRASIPVICAGNITLGGVGKTPFVQLLCQQLTDMGHTPFILMRGYGGTEKGPLRVRISHTAQEVGDEARMHAQSFPVIISGDRPAGAQLAAREGASIIVMDDGFQNPSLHKDLAFVLIDGTAGLGNGKVFPAGPLREEPTDAFTRAQAIVMVGETDEHRSVLPETDLPLLTARITSQIDGELKNQRLHAFSGIGRPEKFFSGLEKAGLTVPQKTPFADHHMFSAAEIARLKAAAAEDDALLVTTEKDYARLSADDAAGIHPIPAHMSVDQPDLLAQFLRSLPEPA